MLGITILVRPKEGGVSQGWGGFVYPMYNKLKFKFDNMEGFIGKQTYNTMGLEYQGNDKVNIVKIQAIKREL